MEGVRHNYSYFPVLVDPGEFGASRDELYDYLMHHNIITRKYFYPLVSDYREFKEFKTGDLPVAQKIAGSILCLPLYHDISDEQVAYVVHTIHQLQRETRHVNSYIRK
jgi:dTDP-4-amino-4,6-dideoxygalactose transaminase